MRQVWITYGSRFRQAALAVTGAAALALIAFSAVGEDVQLVNVGLVLLLLTLLVSATFGFWAGVTAAIVSNFILMYFFVAPVFRFWADDPQELACLPVFLLASAIGTSLLEASRLAAEQARQDQARSEALLSLDRAIFGASDPHSSLDALCREVVRAFASRNAAVFVHEAGSWNLVASAGHGTRGLHPSSTEADLADQALNNGARRRDEAAPDSPIVRAAGEVMFVPLAVPGRNIGVLRLEGPYGSTRFSSDAETVLMAFAREAALAISRLELANAASRADALRQADEMKTAILSSISHELKTPLATIKQSTSSLLEDGVAWSRADQADFLEAIREETDRLDKTISDLLDLNRLESGTLGPIIELQSVCQVVEDAVALKSAVLEGRRLVFDVPDMAVYTDGSLIRQSLANLLENAARHSRPDGAITVSGEACGASVRITVADEGPGVEPDELPFIFNPFYRARNGRAAPNGTGLGLAIVKGFVTLCEGDVRAESSATCTRFTVELPLRPA